MKIVWLAFFKKLCQYDWLLERVFFDTNLSLPAGIGVSPLELPPSPWNNVWVINKWDEGKVGSRLKSV